MSKSYLIGASVVVAVAAATAARLAIPAWGDAIAAGGALLAAWILVGDLLSRLRGLKATFPSEFERTLAVSPSKPERPGDLRAAERVFGWKIYQPGEFEHRIKPVLLAMTRSKLRERGLLGASGDGDLRPHLAGPLGRLDPERRVDTTVGTEDIAAMVAAIEKL